MAGEIVRRRCGTARIARIIRDALREGHVVDIEGFGTFRPAKDGGFDFAREMRPRIFIAYVEEDLADVQRLYRALNDAGYRPWMDKESLLPGQNWPRSIDRAIEVSDFFIACFSRKSVPKRGVFQSELRYALDCASRLPLDDIFIIPVRLDCCTPPERIVRSIQHVDLFGDWNAGFAQIRRTIDQEHARRQRTRLPLAS
jgi:hypothetical protein